MDASLAFGYGKDSPAIKEGRIAAAQVFDRVRVRVRILCLYLSAPSSAPVPVTCAFACVSICVRQCARVRYTLTLEYTQVLSGTGGGRVAFEFMARFVGKNTPIYSEFDSACLPVSRRVLGLLSYSIYSIPIFIPGMSACMLL